MDFVTAAFILTWVVLVVMAFALAGMLRQIRDLQAALVRGDIGRSPVAPEAVRPADPASLAIVLVADDNCPVCGELAPRLPALAAAAPADIDFVVVTSTASDKWLRLGGDRVRVVADRDVHHRVDPGWRPALLAVTGVGEVLAAEPVGTVEQLHSVVGSFAGTRLELQAQGG